MGAARATDAAGATVGRIWTLRTSSSSMLGKVLYTTKAEDAARAEGAAEVTVGRTWMLGTSSSSMLGKVKW